MHSNDYGNLEAQAKLIVNKIKLKNKSKKIQTKLALKNKLTKEFMQHVQRSNQKKSRAKNGEVYTQSYWQNSVFKGINQTYSMNESFNNENVVGNNC